MTESLPRSPQQRIIKNLTDLHQQVRLYRLAKELGVSRELLSRLEPSLTISAEGEVPSNIDKPAKPLQIPELKLTLSQTPAPKAVPAEANAKPQAPAEQGLSPKQQVEQLALAKGVADKAAQFRRYEPWLMEQFPKLDGFIRDKIIACFDAKEQPTFAVTVPAAERSDLEHLGHFLWRRGSEASGEAGTQPRGLEAALAYSLEYHGELLGALQRETRVFATDSDLLALSWAEPMLARGWQKQGFAVLSIVPGTRHGKENPHYHEALMLAAKYRDEKSTSELMTRLQNQYDPKLQRQQLAFWLKKAQPKSSAPSAKALWLRGSLQPIFADLLDTFERHPTSLSQMAELLISHRDMLAEMPYLWDAMKTASRLFMTPGLTHALWRRFAQLSCPSDAHPVQRGVVAAAKLHMFLLDTNREEAGVWWAKAQFEDRAVAQAMGFSWSGLACKWLASLDTPHRRTIEGRDYLKAFVRLTLGAPITASQFHRYLKLSQNPAEASLAAVLRRSSRGFGHSTSSREAKAKPDVAIEAYARLILVRPLTNSELDDWLRLTESSQHLDLAWRLTTVLKFRMVLSSAYDSAWLYSSENQNPPPLTAIEASELTAFFPYHPLAQKLLNGFVQAGPLLATVFGCGKPQSAEATKVSTDPLAQLAWGIAKEEEPWDERCVSMLLDQLPDKARQPFTPPLITSASLTGGDVRARQWLLTYHRVCQFYGLARLEFHLSNLTALEERLVASTCFGDGKARPAAPKSAEQSVDAERFFALTAPQKQQLREFLSLGRHFQSATGEVWGQRMMILLTLIHLPSHYFALGILEEINCSLETIRWAESMILTKGYSELRLRQGLAGQIPFPQNLRNFARISP